MTSALLTSAKYRSGRLFSDCQRQQPQPDPRPLQTALEEKLGRAGYSPKQIEGYDTANWILMDYGDIIVHIFDRENRLFYDLERIWRDGKRIAREDFN